MLLHAPGLGIPRSLLLFAVAVAVFLPAVKPTATFFKVEDSSRRFYCLPQGYETSIDKGFNSKQDEPRKAVLLELIHECDDVGPIGTAVPVSQTIAEEVKGNIAILVMSDCPFSTYSGFGRDAASRIIAASRLGATGVILLFTNPGMPVAFLPGTLRIPTCLMDMANGDALLSVVDDESKSVNVIIEPANMPLHTANDDTSAGESKLFVDGVFTLEPPLPAWPALFMDLEALVDKTPSGAPVLARMSSTCSVKDDGQGEYPQCQQCWKLHDEDPSLVFQNSADFRGSVVLFHFKTLAEERSQRCYPEYYQLAVLAQELGAKGVLFGMDSDTERPEFPGPGQIPALFQIPAFSILRPHAIALAAAAEAPGVVVTFPIFKDNLGFPPFFASEGRSLSNTTVVFEVEKKDGEIGEIQCDAGQSISNPLSWEPISSKAVITRPGGRCTYMDGSGCFLGPESSKEVVGNILVMFLEDFPFFHEWSQHAKLAADAGATALVVVNLNSDIFTFLTSSSNSSSIPMFNVDENCGSQMLSAAQLTEKSKPGAPPPKNKDGLSFTMRLPGGKAGIAEGDGKRFLLEPLSLFQEEFQGVTQQLPLSQMTFKASTSTGESEEGAFDVGQALFNPIFHRGFSSPVVAASPVPECTRENSDAGLSCQACDESAQKFLAAPFPGAIVLVRDTFLPCVHHVDMTLEFEARGAKAVVVSNDGDYFRTFPRKDFRESTNPTTIPTFNTMSLVGEKIFSWLDNKWEVSFSAPSIREGRAQSCTSGNCDNTEAFFANYQLWNESTPAPTASVTQLEATKDDSKNSLSSGGKIAIGIVSILAGCIIIAVLVFFLLRQRRKHKRYEVFEPGTQLPTRSKPADDVPL